MVKVVLIFTPNVKVERVPLHKRHSVVGTNSANNTVLVQHSTWEMRTAEPHIPDTGVPMNDNECFPTASSHSVRDGC